MKILAIVLFLAAISVSHSIASQKSAIRYNLNKLRSLQGYSPFDAVSKPLIQLVKLNPKKTRDYLRIADEHMLYSDRKGQHGYILGAHLSRIVKHSELSEAKKYVILKLIYFYFISWYVPPTPTPTPYIESNIHTPTPSIR
jgi:hypothetical protein